MQALELMRIDNGNEIPVCAARRVFCDEDGGQLGNRKAESKSGFTKQR